MSPAPAVSAFWPLESASARSFSSVVARYSAPPAGTPPEVLADLQTKMAEAFGETFWWALGLVAIAFVVITFLHVVIGELIPKGIALGHSETVALAVSTPVRGFFFVFKPLIWVLEKSSNWALRALGLEVPGEDRGAP